MSKSQPSGCLAIFFGPFAPSGRETAAAEAADPDDLPFRLRDDFLSPAEFSFYKVLASAVGGQAVVCCKVRLADLFFAHGDQKRGKQNKIDRKHVDFLLCDPTTMKPRCGVELDDSSHQRKKAQDRDELVDGVFTAAGLPLVRVPVRSAYSVTELQQQIAPLLTAQPAAITPPTPSVAPSPTTASTQPPTCPKCKIPMVVRVAKKGPRTGQRLFACTNYPQCREIKPV